MRLILFIDLLVEGSKIFLIHVARSQKKWVTSGVGRERLVERVITDDVRVVGETG